MLQRDQQNNMQQNQPQNFNADSDDLFKDFNTNTQVQMNNNMPDFLEMAGSAPQNNYGTQQQNNANQDVFNFDAFGPPKNNNNNNFNNQFNQNAMGQNVFNGGFSANNNQAAMGKQGEKSAFDDDADCELGSDLDVSELDNPMSAMKDIMNNNMMNSGRL